MFSGTVMSAGNTAVISMRRDGRRTLCAAEGVVAVLRHCSLDDAFLALTSEEK